MSREVLQMALDALEQWNTPLYKRGTAITAIKEALAQPEQEPVTWRNAAIRVGEDLCSVGPFGYYDMTAEQWLYWALSVVTVHAPPPQRKPLTDEEIMDLCRSLPTTQYTTAFARAIEAAHGIKGKA